MHPQQRTAIPLWPNQSPSTPRPARYRSAGRRSIVNLRAVVSMAVLAGCAVGTQGTTVPAPVTAIPDPVAQSATLAGLRGAGTVCDPNPNRRIVINRGTASCTQAVKLVDSTFTP